MAHKLMAGGLLAAVLLSWPAGAQIDRSATIYSRGHYQGSQRSLVGPTQLQSPWVIKSVKLPAGSAWEFCSGKSFSGCRQISQSTPAMVMTVRSARPVGAVIPASATPAASALSGGQSLRGMASEYFVAPADGQGRIQVPAGTVEAGSRRAGEFCRAHGWRSSAYQRLQSVGGVIYLADLLCADS